MKRIVFLILMFVLSIKAVAQNFKDTYELIQNKNYFKAKSKYFEHRNKYSLPERKVIEACIFNAFNNPSKSNKIINQLLGVKRVLPDTILLKLHRIKTDNNFKLYKYEDAKNNIQQILEVYDKLLTEKETDDLKNSLKIWTAFQNEPPQKIKLNNPNPIKMEIDKAGLKNLAIRTKEDTSNFIFDTGANISCVIKKTAEKLNMKILPVDIEVGTITGKKTNAQLAICPILYLEKIEIRNAIFLVFSDESLYISEIDYQINGILGFPVIEALGEVKISNDGYFTVTENKTRKNSNSNMALDGLTPLIYIDGKHYSFDTGADETLFYQTFFKEHKEEIEQKYIKEKFGFAGAGGSKSFEGYKISYDMNINGKKVTLNGVQVLTEKLKPDETVYGNIGQDLIKQFSSMTINFEKMYIHFE